MRPGDTVEVDCVGLDDDGAGITSATENELGLDVCLHVAGALPGERVAAVVEHVSPHARQAWARLQTIATSSPARRPPACAAFGACGGCVLQHLAYDAQLDWKAARVRGALGRYPSLASVPVSAAVASPRPLGYRNRSKLVAARREGRFVLGAYAPRSHEVVDLAGCAIAEPPLDELARAVAALFERARVAPYDERALVGDLRHVVLQRNHAGEVLATWVSRRPLPDGIALARALRTERPEVRGVVEHLNHRRGNAIFDPGGRATVLDGTGSLDEVVDVGGRPVRLVLSSGAFFQANREVAGLAYAAIAAIAANFAPHPGERVVDAYSGIGGIALTLATEGGPEVIGIEAHPGAVEDARTAAARAGLTRVAFRAADASAGLAAIDQADLLVLNPPRKGCAPGVVAEVARLAPRAIAYLSCDPDTLARDLAAFATRGWATMAVTPFDMLPHTPHVECLALLRRLGLHSR